MPGTVSRSATSPGLWCVRPPEATSKDPPLPDEHAADALVGEAELDLLEGALDEEGADGVDDRAQTGERHPGADVDQQLLADADVDDPLGVATDGVAEVLPGDLGPDQRQVGPLVEQVGDGGGELQPRRGRAHERTSATTHGGTPGGRADSAGASAAWSRPSTVATAHPSVAKRCAIRPGEP